MLNNPLILLGASAIAVTSAAAASAAQAPAAKPQTLSRASVAADLAATFKAADTNNDGMLTQAEIAAAEARAVQARLAAVRREMEAAFAKADTNKDGQLNKAEFLAAGPQAPSAAPTGAEVLAAMDKNKDSKVSLTEFGAERLALFDAIDANKDGVLSDSERAAAARRR